MIYMSIQMDNHTQIQITLLKSVPVCNSDRILELSNQKLLNVKNIFSLPGSFISLMRNVCEYIGSDAEQIHGIEEKLKTI